MLQIVWHGSFLQFVWQSVDVAVIQVDVDSGSSSGSSPRSTVPQPAVHVGLGAPEVKCVVGLPLSGGHMMEKIPPIRKHGGFGTGGNRIAGGSGGGGGGGGGGGPGVGPGLGVGLTGDQ